MARGRPVGPETRAKVISLFREGNSRNAIAKLAGSARLPSRRSWVKTGSRSKSAAAGTRKPLPHAPVLGQGERHQAAE